MHYHTFWGLGWLPLKCGIWRTHLSLSLFVCLFVIKMIKQRSQNLHPQPAPPAILWHYSLGIICACVAFSKLNLLLLNICTCSDPGRNWVPYSLQFPSPENVRPWYDLLFSDVLMNCSAYHIQIRFEGFQLLLRFWVLTFFDRGGGFGDREGEKWQRRKNFLQRSKPVMINF